MLTTEDRALEPMCLDVPMDSDRLSRRRMLAALGATGVAGLAGCTGDGDDGATPTDEDTPTDGSGGTATPTGTPEPVSGTLTIGALQPLSGALQYYGQSALWGFFGGFGYKGDLSAGDLPDATTGTKTMTVGDVDYEIVVRDTTAEGGAQAQAETLVTDDGVDMLFGTTSSAAAQAVVTNVTKVSGVPTVIGPAASAGVTSSSSTCGENVFRASENVAMDARSGGKYVAENTDISSVYLFGADYSFGQSVVNNYEKVLRANDVEIAGTKFVAQGTEEWAGLLDNAEATGAEGVVTGFTAATLPFLFDAFLSGDYSFQAIGGLPSVVGHTAIGNTMRRVLGEPLTQEKIDATNIGALTTRYHWNQYDNDVNSAFVDMHTSAYGSVPDLFSSGTFTAASSIAQAVEAGGSLAPADIRAEMTGMTVTDTPKGEGGYTYQTYNNQARSEMTVVNMAVTEEENWDAPVQPSEPVGSVAAGETTLPADDPDMGCSL